MDLSQPKVMGIINLTPDSFFASSRKQVISEVLRKAEQMLTDGATFLDVGGYSSRPGADDITEEEELRRVMEPIEALRERFPEAILSIDTFRSKIAARAVESGADVVNDISAGHLDGNMLATVAQLEVPYIGMHMQGNPQTMKTMTSYEDILVDTKKYFSMVLSDCNDLGVKDVIIDPGFGFAKTSEQSFHVLSNLELYQHLGKPILVGLSRKSMIYKSLKMTADEALNGTTVLNTVALLKGASILRVHDVKEAVEAVKLVDQLK